MMMDYFFNRQSIEILTEDGEPMYQAQVNLLNHIKTGYTTAIPTAELLYKKVEDAAEDVVKPLPAIYSLFAEGDVHKNADNPYDIPLVVIAASNHHNKEAHFEDATALAVGIAEWLQEHSYYSGTERNYRVLSPVRVAPYKVAERYTIMTLIISIIEFK